MDVPRFWLGPRFEDLKMSRELRQCSEPSAVGRTNLASYIYGDCVVGSAGACTPPLEVQTYPACERSRDPHRLTPEGGQLPHQEGQVAGRRAAVFEDGRRLELYTADATVVIFGRSPGQVRRAAAAVRRAAAGPGTVTMQCPTTG